MYNNAPITRNDGTAQAHGYREGGGGAGAGYPNNLIKVKNGARKIHCTFVSHEMRGIQKNFLLKYECNIEAELILA